MQQFLRKTRVIFSGSDTGFTVNPNLSVDEELRVDFNIVRSISSEANTGTVTIYNLTQSHRAAVGRELDDMNIECGYLPPSGDGSIGTIFKGQIRDVTHSRQGADILTTITCGDGDKALRNAVISRTFPAGTSVKSVMEGIFEEMRGYGVQRGEWVLPDDIGSFMRPYSMCGGCLRELNTISRGKGFYWSIQNGVLEVVKASGFLAGAVLINEASGMVGSPRIKDKGIEVDVLLNPEIRPNRTIKVESSIVDLNAEDGLYRVSSVKYAGSNRQGNFYATVTGEAIIGGAVT